MPGARGRAVFLALAASNLVTYVAVKSAGTSLARLGASVAGTSPGLRGPGGSDTGTVTALGLVFGLGYYAIAAALDRSRRPGAAVAFVYAGFGATVLGLASGFDSFGRVGTGIALVLVGGVLAAYGGLGCAPVHDLGLDRRRRAGRRGARLEDRSRSLRHHRPGAGRRRRGRGGRAPGSCSAPLHERPDVDETSPALQPGAPAR